MSEENETGKRQLSLKEAKDLYDEIVKCSFSVQKPIQGIKMLRELSVKYFDRGNATGGSAAHTEYLIGIIANCEGRIEALQSQERFLLNKITESERKAEETIDKLENEIEELKALVRSQAKFIAGDR